MTKEDQSQNTNSYPVDRFNGFGALLHICGGIILSYWFFTIAEKKSVWLFGVGSGSVVLFVMAGLFILIIPGTEYIKKTAHVTAIRLGVPTFVEDDYVKYKSHMRILVILVNWSAIVIFLWIWQLLGLAVIFLLPIIQDIAFFLYAAPIFGYILFVIFLVAFIDEHLLVRIHADARPILDALNEEKEYPSESVGNNPIDSDDDDQV
ncbi:MAG: hypothetical protein K9W43_11525 [Candidatus Thorarchaeota archaeon]|nr:hypothetical protein [Candidatus Thorarchaeota archaeon]